MLFEWKSVSARLNSVLDQTLYGVRTTFGSSYNLIQCFWIYWWVCLSFRELGQHMYNVHEISFVSMVHQLIQLNIRHSPSISHFLSFFRYLNILSPSGFCTFHSVPYLGARIYFGYKRMVVILFGYHSLCCYSPNASILFVIGLFGVLFTFFFFRRRRRFIYTMLSVFCTSTWLCGIFLGWK